MVYVSCRFAELAWFWDPQQQWLLPCRCATCKVIISSEVIAQSVNHDHGNIDSSVAIECPNCYTKIDRNPQYTNGDPCNIALIGQWDGWQPFSTSLKHSCGICINVS